MAREAIVTTLEGHESWVFSVDFSPDGTLLASVSENVKLWDLHTGQSTTFSLVDGSQALRGSVDFSPDGRMLAALSADGVTLLEVATGNATTLATGHTHGPLALALSPDGTRLASTKNLRGINDVHLWDLGTGRVIATLQGHTGRLNSVAFSPDGATLASGASDRTIKLWDVATGARVATLEETGSTWVRAVAFSRDGTMVASGHANGTVRVWDLETREPVTTLEGGSVASVAFSPDGSRLATGGGRFAVWDLASGTSLLKEEEEFGVGSYVAFNAEGTALAYGWDSSTQVSSIWKVPAGGDEATLVVEYRSWGSLAVFARDASIFVVGAYFSGTPSRWGHVDVLEVRDVATGGLIATLGGHGEQIQDLAVSGDGSTFASGSSDGTILVWDLNRVLPHPRGLTGLSGDGQEGFPNAALDEPFVVVVRDQHGDPFGGAQVTFAVTGGGGTVSVGTATTDAQGQASTTLTLGLAPGPNTVEVTVGDLEPVIFTALTQAVPTTMSKVGGDVQQGASGAPLAEPFIVSLLDQAGRPLAGVTVTFAVTAGEGTLSVTRATADAQGRAATTLTPGRTPGINTVEVTVAGLAPVTFTALGRAVPRTLTKLSGDEQQGEPGTALGEALAVSVQDQNGAPLPGAVVTFAVLGDGGTLSALTDTTDAKGRAATTLTLGEEFGTYTVVATVADLEPVTFTVAAKASPDFDDDGEVGFSDFFLFAEAFGGSDPRFDLDGSGTGGLRRLLPLRRAASASRRGPS